jgi:hypothetical protein
MPIDNKRFGIWDKLIVNLEGTPKIYIIDLDYRITDDLFEFNAPVLIGPDNKIADHDGYHLYHDVLAAGATHKHISLPDSKAKSMVPDIIISNIRFEMDMSNDYIASFHFEVEHGLRNGLEKQIKDISRPGLYLLNYVLHCQLPWWQQYNIAPVPLRIAKWSDIKFPEV